MAKVMVAGYFDGLHSGHIRFFQDASHFGQLTVGVTNDERLRKIKGRDPMCCEKERLYMVQSCKYVDHAFIIPTVEGKGGVIWEEYLDSIKPDYWIVNDDLSQKWIDIQKTTCERHNVKFLVLKRSPFADLVERSSTDMSLSLLPYRVVLSTWLDQATLGHGCCVGFSIEPDRQYEDGCGMSTSTRKSIRKIWGNRLPNRTDYEEMAKLVFSVDNPPKCKVDPCKTFPWGSYASRWITGAIDPIAVVFPGITKSTYADGPWPKIEHIMDEDTLNWLEKVVTLSPTQPRPKGECFQLTPTPEKHKLLAEMSERVWTAIKEKNTVNLAVATSGCAHAIGNMSNTYFSHGVWEKTLSLSNDVMGCFPQGTGGGGYIACVNDTPGDRIKIRIRRK